MVWVSNKCLVSEMVMSNKEGKLEEVSIIMVKRERSQRCEKF